MYIKRSSNCEFSRSEGVDSNGTQCSRFDENDSITVGIVNWIDDRYSGATSLFMTVLLNKKYSLPYVLIDALVQYFNSFESDDRELPILWQQVSNE